VLLAFSTLLLTTLHKTRERVLYSKNPKTVQGILGHSRIQTTLDLYADQDLDEMIATQEKFIDAVGFERETVQ
jgi:integrase